MGTSVGLVSLGELENPDSDSFCSGEDSVEEAPESGPIMVVEVTRGLKAENGDCQFMVGSVFFTPHAGRDTGNRPGVGQWELGTSLF